MSTPVLRTAWRRLAPTDKLRRRAFALDTVVIDITYIVGPALVGLLLWLASPNQAVMAATLSACAGTILILSTAVVRTNVGSHTAVWVNPLRSGKLMTLLLAVIAVLFALGIFEVAIVGFSATHNNPALAGILLSLWSVGSAIGGLWFGTLDSSMTPLRRYQWGLLALAITHGLLPLVTDVRVMVITLILAGLTLAPTMANQAEIASSIANPDTSTQIYAWISTMGYVGLAFGATIGGALLEKTNGFTWAFSAGTASLFVAFLVAVIGAYNWTVPRPIEISDNSQTATAPQSQSFSKVQ